MGWLNDACEGLGGLIVGTYDFLSDRVDDVSTVIGGVNDWARENVPAVADVEDFIHGSYTALMTDVPVVNGVKREIDKGVLATLYVPAKIRHTARIIEDFDRQVDSIGNDAKKTISSIEDQLDDEIKGKFSTAIKDSIESKNSKWDKLV